MGSKDTDFKIDFQTDFGVVVEYFPELPADYERQCRDAIKREKVIIRHEDDIASIEVAAGRSYYENIGQPVEAKIQRRVGDGERTNQIELTNIWRNYQDGSNRKSYAYAQACDLNRDRIPDAIAALDNNQGFVTFTLNADCSLPLGVQTFFADVPTVYLTERYGFSTPGIPFLNVFADKPNKNCGFIYEVAKYDRNYLPAELEAAKQSANLEITYEDYLAYARDEVPINPEKVSEVYGYANDDKKIRLFLQYTFMSIVDLVSPYRFSHAYALLINDDDDLDYIVETNEGVDVVFMSQPISSKAEASICLVDSAFSYTQCAEGRWVVEGEPLKSQFSASPDQ